MHRPIALDVAYSFNNNLIYETDLLGVITYANQSFCEVSGFRKEELIGKNHSIFKHPDVPNELYDNLWSTKKRLKQWFSVLKNMRRDGMYFWSDIHCTIKYDNNKEIGFLIVHKPTSKLNIEEESERYAQYNIE
ncbi:MAG TPA: PAS domain S-box protein [Flavobacteriaceae bacterium]|nr:PAS domain S-box protein [Flavobacteriaceae bacterium]